MKRGGCLSVPPRMRIIAPRFWFNRFWFNFDKTRIQANNGQAANGRIETGKIAGQPSGNESRAGWPRIVDAPPGVFIFDDKPLDDEPRAPAGHAQARFIA